MNFRKLGEVKQSNVKWEGAHHPYILAACERRIAKDAAYEV